MARHQAKEDPNPDPAGNPGRTGQGERELESRMDAAEELQRQGVSPKTWPEVMAAVKASLDPAAWETFSRLHKNFTGYRSESTLNRFYAFVFSHGLQREVNGFRHGRLLGILTDLVRELAPGLAILDVGAGAGIIAGAVIRHFAPKAYVVQDACAGVRDELKAQGLTVLPHPAPAAPEGGPFDLLICADSLGEINADDDGRLANPLAVDPGELPDMLEERYGFAEKLRPWRAYLAPGGRILLWEPFAYRGVWEALAVSLGRAGWQARLSGETGRPYLELRPI
jgi:hypothetical protein